MASLLDPFGLWAPTTRTVVRTSAQMVRTGTQVATWTERQVLGALRSRLDAVAPSLAITASAEASIAPLQTKLDQLLDRALGQNTRSSRQELFHKLLDQLVPDEARIIGALSDGSTSPMVHVLSRSVTGGSGKPILENASLIGKMANVSLPQMTPAYVSHLLSLGLLETGPADHSLKDEYQILCADSMVLRSIKRGKRGPLEAKVEKYTVRLSVLGLDLWAASTSGELG